MTGHWRILSYACTYVKEIVLDKSSFVTGREVSPQQLTVDKLEAMAKKETNNENCVNINQLNRFLLILMIVILLN